MKIPLFTEINFENTKSFYKTAYENCNISENVSLMQRVAKVIEIINQNKDRYLKIEKMTKVPWFWIAAIHNLEGSCKFTTYLHNGDPLGQPTVNVPKDVGPFYTWEESAIDVIKTKKLDKIPEWTLERMLYQAERFNGTGYLKRQLFSPYVWACTDHYKKGKYTRDGFYDPEAISKQVGVAAILKILYK